MTREEAKELIPIVQAYADGKIIQAKWRSESGDKWEDMPAINSFMEDVEYRIKPEPREFYVALYGDKRVCLHGLVTTLAEAKDKWPSAELIKVREVL